MHNISVEQRKVYQQAWMESLAHLFSMIVAFDQELEDKRQQLQLAGERIFDSMDTYQQGFVSLGQFERWIADNCGFQVKRDDLMALQKSLDANNDYRITRDEFINSVSVVVDEEDDEQDDQVQAKQAK